MLTTRGQHPRGPPLALAFPSSCLCLCLGSARAAVCQGKGLHWGCLSHGNVFLADGELYTGTVSSFQGNDPAISRSQSQRPIKTESSLNWLQGELLLYPTQPRDSEGTRQGAPTGPQVRGTVPYRASLCPCPIFCRPSLCGLSLHPREPGQPTRG